MENPVPQETHALPGPVAAHLDRGFDRFVRELAELVAIPSVSTQKSHREDMARCARWLADHLEGMGMERCEVIPASGHPSVRAEWRHRPGAPTLLVYGHYDVQPSEPLDDWDGPPFEPVIANGAIRGRGASDDKGQFFAHLKALEAWLASGGPPVNVVCLLEGEEEIGSPGLPALLRGRRRDFAADVAVVSDTAMPGPGRPALTYALRGDLYLDLEISGPRHALHSGNFGGAVYNPLQALCEVVAGLHDAKGRIAIRGFYDKVLRPDPAERGFMARNGPKDRQALEWAGVGTGWGEEGYTPYERMTLRPSLSVSGLSGGYQGPGVKGVIPDSARAKLDFRLVPDQEPGEVERLFRIHMHKVCPPGLRYRVARRMAIRPVELDRRHPAMEAAGRAYLRGFGRAPSQLRSGGSIPVVSLLSGELGIPAILMGFGLPSDNPHGANENFRLSTFRAAMRTSASFLEELAATYARRSPIPSPSPGGLV